MKESDGVGRDCHSVRCTDYEAEAGWLEDAAEIGKKRLSRSRRRNAEDRTHIISQETLIFLVDGELVEYRRAVVQPIMMQ